MVLLVGLLPGLVMRLALLLVGVARFVVVRKGGLGSLVAAAYQPSPERTPWRPWRRPGQETRPRPKPLS